MYAAGQSQPTVGSLFAGIGGFDIGFERAGFRTAWQVEINPIARAVLADRFPHAKQFEDVCAVGADQLDRVDVVVGGFPCQRKLPLQVDTAR
ncbi:DNA cytosine methyltransferase [Achromobacter spanius]